MQTPFPPELNPKYLIYLGFSFFAVVTPKLTAKPALDYLYVYADSRCVSIRQACQCAPVAKAATCGEPTFSWMVGRLPFRVKDGDRMLWKVAIESL